MLNVENLTVEIDGKEVVKDVSINFNNGMYVILGKNGSGKTSFLMSLMGVGKYKIASGKITLDGVDITHKTVYERARLGLALGFQKPPKIDGVRLVEILKGDYKKYLDILKIDESFLRKEINKGLSGGEMKRTELLQILAMNPKVALLDEPDSGVDIDSINYVLKAINELAKNSTVIVVTHNITTVERLKPKRIFIMKSGKIIAEGGMEILEHVSRNGLGEWNV